MPAGFRDAARQPFPSHSEDRLLASGIDIEDENTVGILERSCKFVDQQLCARVAVRLKDNVHAFVSALSRRSESGADLGGMVSVVINHVDAVSTSPQLEAAIDAAEVP